MNFDAHPRSSLIVALDFDSLSSAVKFAKQVADVVGIFKIGNQPINAQINAYSMSLRPTTLALIGNYARSGHSFSRPIEQ